MTREYGGGDPDQLVRAVGGVERGVSLHLGHVAQAELARISDPLGVRHAIEAVVGQGAADSPAQLAVALLKEHRSRVVGLNSAATKPLARARADRDALAHAVTEAELQRVAVDELAAERDSAHAAAAAAARRVHALEHAAARPGSRAPPADRVRRRAGPAARAAAEVAEREAAYAGFAPSDEIGPLRHRLRDLEAERDRRSGERVLDTQRLGDVERERTALAARAGALAPNRGATARAPEVEALASAAARGNDGRKRLLGLGALAGVAAALAFALGQPILAVVAAIAGVVLVTLAARSRRPAATELERVLPLEPGKEGGRQCIEIDEHRGGPLVVELPPGRYDVEVSYAGLRADLAALDQIEHERAQVSERVRSELLRAGFDDLDLEDGLHRYDTAASGHALLVDAAATRRQKTAELERLLGEESLDEARRQLREIETTLNGHAALAEGATSRRSTPSGLPPRPSAIVPPSAPPRSRPGSPSGSRPPPGLRSSASSSRRRPSASPTSSTATPCSGSPRPSSRPPPTRRIATSRRSWERRSPSRSAG